VVLDWGKGEHPGSTALDLADVAAEGHPGVGIDVDVDLLTRVDVVDIGLIDPGGHVNLGQIVGNGQLGA
jgi:hypothetical protein